MQEEIQTPHEFQTKAEDTSEFEEFEMSMEDWLGDGEHDHRRLRRGEIVRGYIVHIGDDGLMIDIGAKSEGLVPPNDLRRLGDEAVAELKEGDSVYVYCITPEDRQGNILLSLSQAQVARDWEEAAKLYESGELIQAEVAGHNKGGLIVYFGKVRGFVPASQLSRRRRGRYQNAESAQPWAELVGEELWLKIIECQPENNRLIFSEQAAARQRRKAMRDELLAGLKEGDVLTGEVTSLADFGAFVDLGGADGLIHISELSWERVKHPSEVLAIGDEVEVRVINVDTERKRIGLSLKRLQPEPWEVIEQNYQVGDLIQGTVTKITNFGAFAQVTGGFEGLIHISELTDRAITHPSEVVKIGDKVTLRIIRIEPERRRIGLSLRQVDDEVWLGLDVAGAEEEEPGTVEEEATEPATSNLEAQTETEPNEETVMESER